MLSYAQNQKEYFKNSRHFFYAIIDLNGNYCYANPFFLQRFSNITSDFTGSSFTSAIIQGDLDQYRQAIDECLMQKVQIATVDLRMPVPDNSNCLTRWEFSVLRNEKGESGFIQCIGVTIKRNNDTIEKRSEKFYRSLIANTRDGMLIMNENMQLIFASPSLKNLLGYEVEEVIGKNAFDFIHPDDRDAAMKPFQNETKRTADINSIVIRLLKRNGEWLWCMVRSYNLIDNPDVNGVVIHFFDYTLPKQARDTLKESEERFRNLISNLQLGVVLRNAANKALICNKAALELFDVREEDLIGKTMHQIGLDYMREDETILNIDEHPCCVAARTKKPVRDIVLGVYRKNKNNWVWLLFSADPILDENNEVIQVVSSFVDISERKKLQQKLIDEEIDKHKLITKATIEGQEKERKEIGKELHDSIGQQLTTTKLYLDLAKSTADEATAELVCLATKSVSDVINDVRTISYSLVPPSLGDLGLIESIKDLYESLNKVKSISIDFYYEFFREEQLTDNLKLTLFRIFQEHMNNIVKYSQATNVIIHLDMELDMILLEISDDGIGFDLENVKRGLGLMNISNRVHLFNGKALIKTEPGKGCSLIISIPIPVNKVS
jgi:PAS domain S-box-containing protein